MRIWVRVVALTCIPLPLAAQAAPSLDRLALRLSAMTAVAGYAQAMADSLGGLLPGATQDRLGNLVLSMGSGERRVLLACPMDEPGFLVGGVRPDGYLTLRRAGPGPAPLADQQLEGQRVTVLGRKGAVPGVVGVRSTHLTRGRATVDVPFTLDEAYVDIGAVDSAGAARLGIEVLAPITRSKAPLRYGDSLLAAPVAGRRAACAALVRAALLAGPIPGKVTVAFLVDTRRGLLALGRRLGPFQEVVLVDGMTGPGHAQPADSPDPTHLGGFTVLGLSVRYGGTPVETVSLVEAARLERSLLDRMRGVE
jgi:putative aminopeptidase FrvX